MELNIVPLLQTLAVGIGRSFGGWLENVLDDGKITPFEWQRLGATVLRVSFITTSLYFGITEFFGQDVNVIGASAAAFFVDWIVLKLKSKRK